MFKSLTFGALILSTSLPIISINYFAATLYTFTSFIITEDRIKCSFTQVRSTVPKWNSLKIW